MGGNYLLIAGDLSITASNAQHFISGNVTPLIDPSLWELIDNSALFSVNHEMALTDSDQKMQKRGGFLKASPPCAKGIAALGIDLCMLANNHIIDYRETGVSDTIVALDQHGICHIGAAGKKTELQKAYFTKVAGVNVGFYNVADNEFNAATDLHAGANVYDPLETFDEIKAAKQQCDYLIVVYHGGVERYRYPTPNLQKICKKMADVGADVVLCQHSHCIGSYESYNGSYILYGQGNFLFDDGENEYYNSGLVMQVFPETRQVVPRVILKNKNGVCLADVEKEAEILEQFESRSELIKQDGRVEEMFRDYIGRHKTVYLNALTGNNIIFRSMNKLTKGRFYRSLFSGMNRLRLINLFNAEALMECMKASMEYSQD